MKRIHALLLTLITIAIGLAFLAQVITTAQPQTPYMVVMHKCGTLLSMADATKSWHTSIDEAKAYADSQFNGNYNIAYIYQPQSPIVWTPLLWFKTNGADCYNGNFTQWTIPTP